jgi:hypothetical protein
VCTRGSDRTLSRGPSTSPLEAMRRPRRTVDSLEYVELAFLLDEAGVRLSEAQFASLKPYLVPLRRVEAVSGQLHTEVQIFARRGSAALAIDDTFATLLVGNSDGTSALRDAQRYSSPEMALRAFLSEARHGL